MYMQTDKRFEHAHGSHAAGLTRRAGLTLGATAALGLLAQHQSAWAEDLPQLMARVKRSVVLIGTYSETDAPRFQFRGTGFAVGSGLDIITNAHVLPEPADSNPTRSLQVRVWGGGKEWQARSTELVSLARAQDLAHLRIEGPALTPLELAGPAVAREGGDVALVGFPVAGALGFSHVVHRGVIAAITAIALPQASSQGLSARTVRAIREGTFEILQLDATAYPGNSGGPVFDLASGRVVGVLNMVLTKGSREAALSSPTGISYAVPVRHVVDLLAQK